MRIELASEELGPLALLRQAPLGRGQLEARLLELTGGGFQGGLERGPRPFLVPLFEPALEELDEGAVETQPPRPGARCKRRLERPGDAPEQNLATRSR